MLFIKSLDDIHTEDEQKATFTRTKIANPIFSAEQQDLRESKKISTFTKGYWRTN
ncbi:MAG TPA: hypothetical protein PKY82_11650 [Pyrinomonadaceae bacterium]|nr:hypothetical protein [Pyrinomonadaceae bacterium]